MPVMDGIEASAEIIKLNTGIPIVAMTANIMTGDMDMYKKSGMSDCVSKPFTSQELWRCLLKYFTPVDWQKEDAANREQSDQELRQKLIRAFVNNNGRKADEISAAIKTGDIKLAHRLAHTLKTNAGQLDKTALQEAAEAVEACLMDGGNLVSTQQMAVLKGELDAALAEFVPLVVGEAVQPDADDCEIADTSGKKGCILIVDDDPSNLMQLSHILSQEYKIIALKDSTAALDKACEYLPDLILLDVIMPGMSGHEVLAGLKKSETTKDIPVIFVTGVLASENEGLPAGVADYIRKPLNAAAVKQKVQKHIT
jgi:CheY-like chemotaxis protein